MEEKDTHRVSLRMAYGLIFLIFSYIRCSIALFSMLILVTKKMKKKYIKHGMECFIPLGQQYEIKRQCLLSEVYLTEKIKAKKNTAIAK